MTKFCTSCGKVKPEAQFTEDGRTKDGLSTTCKTCKAAAVVSGAENTGGSYADDRLMAAKVKTTDKAWDGSASRFTDEQYQRSCLIDRGGDASVKERCSLPVLEPDGTLNVNALPAALGRIDGLKDVSDDDVAKAKRKIKSLYKAAGLDVPDSLSSFADATRPELLVALGELETVDVPGIEILSAGGPYFGTGSPPEGDTFSEGFLDELVAANVALAGQVRVPIKIGHSKSQKLLANSGLSIDEQPAAGWLENWRREGPKLLADAKGVPRKIADLMKAQAFRTRSVEMSRVVEQTPDGPGRTFDAVISGLALLGAKAPAVRTLDDILAWYGERGQAVSYLLADEVDAEVERTVDYATDGTIVWDSEDGAMDLMDDLAAALNGPMPSNMDYYVPPRYCVMDVALVGSEAPSALVYDYGTSPPATWVIPFTIGDDREPVPASSTDWILAEQRYVAVAEQAANAMSERLSRFLAKRAEDLRNGADTLGHMGTETQTQTPTLAEEQIASFAQAFGIEETDATKQRDAVLAKFKEFAPAEEVTEPAKPAPAAAASADDDPERAALERRAELGEKAYEERRMERRDANIRVALSQGRIDPADKAKWERFFDENEELALNALVSIPANPTRTQTFGSDETGVAEVVKGMDRAYGALAGALGIRPHSLPVDNGGAA